MKDSGWEFQGAVPNQPLVAPSDLIYLMSSWRLFHPGTCIALSPLPSHPLLPFYNSLSLKA